MEGTQPDRVESGERSLGIESMYLATDLVSTLASEEAWDRL